MSPHRRRAIGYLKRSRGTTPISRFMPCRAFALEAAHRQPNAQVPYGV